MEKYILEKEIKWLKTYYKKCVKYIPLNRIDVSLLYDYYPNTKFLNRLVCSFSPLMENITSPDSLTPLTYDFFETDKVINDRIAVVKYDGVLFLLKQEEHGKVADRIIHEFFVGINLLNILPTFASVIACYSCTPYIPGKASHCEYAGTEHENVNFIMYQYIDGPSLHKATKDKIISLQETWQIVKIVFESVNYAYRMTGFVHQDLHFGNIILIDLGQKMNIKIGNKIFTTKFLPKIIDYARSRIEVDKNVYSPTLPSLRIPSNDTYHDLRYLFWSFYIFDPEFFRFKDTPDKEMENEWWLLNLFELSNFELMKIYDKYDKKYYYKNDSSLPLLEMSQDQQIETNIRPPKEKASVPPNLKSDFRNMYEYNRALDKAEKIFEKINFVRNIFGNCSSVGLLEYLKLVNEYKIKLTDYHLSVVTKCFNNIKNKPEELISEYDALKSQGVMSSP